MRRTIVARRHNGPTQLVAIPERACTIEAPFDEWLWSYGHQPVHIETSDFKGVLYLKHMEPLHDGRYRYHFHEARTE